MTNYYEYLVDMVSKGNTLTEESNKADSKQFILSIIGGVILVFLFVNLLNSHIMKLVLGFIAGLMIFKFRRN